MTLKEHVILGGGAAVGLSQVLGPQDSLIFFASSVLIDVDHYWKYLWHTRFTNWSPRKTFAFHRRLFEKIRDVECVSVDLFHTVECLALVYTASLVLGTGAVFAALWGMVFHLGLDLVRLRVHGVTFKRALSLVEYWIRRRRLIARGFDPDRVYRNTLIEIGAVAAPAGGGLSADPQAAPPPPPSY